MDRTGVDAHPDRLVDQSGLVGEDPEDGALGDAGGFGHLTSGHRRPTLDEEGDHRLDDGPATVVGGKGLSPKSVTHDAGF